MTDNENFRPHKLNPTPRVGFIKQRGLGVYLWCWSCVYYLFTVVCDCVISLLYSKREGFFGEL